MVYGYSDVSFGFVFVVEVQIWNSRVYRKGGEKMQRQTRLMERNNSMRGKRQAEGGEEEQQERKRPALAR